MASLYFILWWTGERGKKREETMRIHEHIKEHFSLSYYSRLIVIHFYLGPTPCRLFSLDLICWILTHSLETMTNYKMRDEKKLILDSKWFSNENLDDSKILVNRNHSSTYLGYRVGVWNLEDTNFSCLIIAGNSNIAIIESNNWNNWKDSLAALCIRFSFFIFKSICFWFFCFLLFYTLDRIKKNVSVTQFYESHSSLKQKSNFIFYVTFLSVVLNLPKYLYWNL